MQRLSFDSVSVMLSYLDASHSSLVPLLEDSGFGDLMPLARVMDSDDSVFSEVQSEN